MSGELAPLRNLSDEAVIARVKACVSGEREATAALVAALSELDVRRLYLGQGFSSLFEYCTRGLHLSERATCSRIAAARLARRFPLVIDLIAGNRVSLTAVSLLAKHLNETNYRLLLLEATHKTASEVEIIVSRLAPKPDVVPLVRRIPSPPPDSPRSLLLSSSLAAAEDSPDTQATMHPLPALPTCAQPARAVIKPLAPERFKVQFTISGETRERLRMTQDLLRHSVPAGDLAAVFDRALVALLVELEKKKWALVARPREKETAGKPLQQTSRTIPAAVRRAVWRRDRGRCAFVGDGGRCRERGALEFHHVVPFAAGGVATVENIQLRCRSHNAHESDLYFTPQRGP